MTFSQNLFTASSIEITPNLCLKIPTIGEILDNEKHYYNLISSLTATPFQYMVQLDDMGIDYTTVTDYELFLNLFSIYAKSDLSLLFGELDTSDFSVFVNTKTNSQVLYSSMNQLTIDEEVYQHLTESIRRIHLLEKVKSKPGNDLAKKYLLEKERKKQQRQQRKPYESYLEKLVVALVNTNEFPYNYETCMALSLYNFNQSFRQIQKKIHFDNTMIGVYSGTIDTSQLSSDCLSWV